MKATNSLSLALLGVFALPVLSSISLAGSTVDAVNKSGYGANIGWMDWRGDTNNGVAIGEFVCSGSLYAANLGWINLGNAAPANGIQYANNSAIDYGVNHDGRGNLRGYAWGANIGWVAFEDIGAPTVDLWTGKLSGYAYGANCGWISLSNSFLSVQTDSIAPGVDSDANGLPDAWERIFFGAVGVDPNADPDHDGMSNRQEYLAGTNPNDATDKFVITDFSTGSNGSISSLTWKSALTRFYYVEETFDLVSPVWLDSGLGRIAPDGALTTRSLGNTNTPSRFYRVRAAKPLMP